MNFHTQYNRKTGALGAIVSASDPHDIAHLVTDEMGLIEGAYSSLDYRVDPQTGAIVAQARCLDRGKSEMRAVSRSSRDRRALNGLTLSSGHRVDTDERSQSNIALAVQRAQLFGTSFEIEWRMADNSVISMGYQDVLDMGAEVAAFISDCQRRKNLADAAIAACTSVDELDSLSIASFFT